MSMCHRRAKSSVEILSPCCPFGRLRFVGMGGSMGADDDGSAGAHLASRDFQAM